MAVRTAKSKGSVKKASSKKSAKVVEKRSLAGKRAGTTKGVIKLGPAQKTMSKSEIVRTIADFAGLSKKEVESVLQTLSEVMGSHLKKGAVGKFVLPGMLKVNVVHKPAVKARKGINPFTGEETTFKAKPARNVIRIKALKKLKDIV